jgi:hypothetical protein
MFSPDAISSFSFDQLLLSSSLFSLSSFSNSFSFPMSIPFANDLVVGRLSELNVAFFSSLSNLYTSF